MENTQEEIWKDIPNYEGYQVSNKGNIRSFKKSTNTNLLPRVLKPIVNDRYIYIGAQINKKRRKLYIHRAIAIVFIPNPLNKPEVNHINGIKHDNRIENLEWCTTHENIAHAAKIGLNKKGEIHPMAKLTKCHVLKIKELSSQGISGRKIAKQMGIVCRTSVRDVLIGKTWRHI